MGGCVVARIWRRTSVVAVCAVVSLSAGVFAQAPAPAQSGARSLSDAEKKEAVTILDLIDSVSGGQTAPNELALTWAGETPLKAAENRQYVPFTVTFDRAAAGPAVTMYWRVVPRTAPAAAPADPATPAPKPATAYEDLQTVTVPAQGDPASVSRSFMVPAGSYDVHVVVKQPASADATAPAPKVSYLVHPIEVPDYWNSELNTSAIIVAQGLEPLAAPPTPQQIAEKPYTALGIGDFVGVGDRTFTKAGELVWFFVIYNARADSANKPDVQVDYAFFRKDAAGAEAPVGKMDPRMLNGQTLDPRFSLAAGHQLQDGQQIPLKSFADGEYRLEIKVTDRLANRTVTQNVTFSVGG